MKINRFLSLVVIGGLLSTAPITAVADTTTVTTVKLTAAQTAAKKAAQKVRLTAFNASKASYATAISSAKKTRDIALAAARTAKKKTAPILVEYSKAVEAAIAGRNLANKNAEAIYAAALKVAGING